MDSATPNLPSRDFEATSQFFGKLGFSEVWRDGGWMILQRGGLVMEFFPHPDLDPAANWFSCCLRLMDVEGFYATCVSAGVQVRESGWPRLHAVQAQAWGGRMGALIDPDGTLVRLIQS